MFQLPGKSAISTDAMVTVFVDLGTFLRTGETLTGTVTVACDDDSVTIDDEAIIASSTIVPANAPLYGESTDRTIGTSRGVLFTVTSSDAVDTSISVSVATTGVTPDQLLKFSLPIEFL